MWAFSGTLMYPVSGDILDSTNQYRKGSSVFYAATGGPCCPMYWLKKYLNVCQIPDKSESHIFCNIAYNRYTDTYSLRPNNSPMSYTRCREIFLNALHSMGYHKSKFGLQFEGKGPNRCVKRRGPTQIIQDP